MQVEEALAGNSRRAAAVREIRDSTGRLHASVGRH
jgi:hypothetical protein